MDADLLPELSGETWVAATYLEEVTADLLPAVSEPDLIIASRLDETLIMVRKWVQSGLAPSWSECLGYLRSYSAGNYSSETCQSIRMVDCGAAGLLRRRLINWWYLSRSIWGLFGDTMILFSLVIWVFPGLCIGCWTGLIGPALGRKYDLIWPAARFVWPVCLSGSPMGPGGHGYSR